MKPTFVKCSRNLQDIKKASVCVGMSHQLEAEHTIATNVKCLTAMYSHL